MIQWLVDGAAIMNQKSLADGSYAPYVRTMKRINMEEAFHFKSGEDMVLTLMGGTQRQKDMCQAAFDRWWWPCIMFFGPPDKASVHNSDFMRWRIKTATNDTLRQMFVDRFTPAAKDLGIKVHLPGPSNPDDPAKPNPNLVADPECRYHEDTGHWGFSSPDWDEFYRVIRGNGPCNKQRVGLRRLSYEQGQWVRRAVMGETPGLPQATN
ncbi:MAG TPA: Phenylacetic acid catabolic protein, partial [Phycisphaerae bacterium]